MDGTDKKNKKLATTTAIVHALRDTHHSQTVQYNKKKKKWKRKIFNKKL